MPGLLLVLFALLAAETKPTPATYVTNADIQAIFKQAPENSVVDKQIRSVNVGKVNVAVAAVYRSAKANQTSIEHDQVTEVYTIIEGSGTMVIGGKMANAERIKADDPTVKVLVGPSIRGRARERREPQGLARRHDHHPSRSSALVQLHRWRHSLFGGARRPRQTSARQIGI
jgi:mannose-6-phosphate isomerase-like protein (cupin superfamily)